MEFVKEKEIKVNVFDRSVFDIDAAYMCTFRYPTFDTIMGKHICILRHVDDECLTFVADGSLNLLNISIDDAPCWTIERMIEPMSEDELNLLEMLLTTYATHATVFSPYINYIDSTMKKLGLNTTEKNEMNIVNEPLICDAYKYVKNKLQTTKEGTTAYTVLKDVCDYIECSMTTHIIQ